MSAGFVNETYFHLPYVRDKKARNSLNSFFSSQNWSCNQVFFPTYISTFRSGPSYARSIQSGSVPVTTGETVAESWATLNGDTGHEFSLSKTELFDSDVKAVGAYNTRPAGAYEVVTGRNAVWMPYVDNHIIDFDPNCITQFRSSDADLRMMGIDFLHDTQPLKSEGDLLVSLAELIREGFPRALGAAILKPSKSKGRKQTVRSVGGEYLNYVFGYKPIISDIVTVYDTISRIDQIVEQWIRDNGKPVRRRRRVTLPRIVNGLDEDAVLGGRLDSFYLKPSTDPSLPNQIISSSGNPSTYGGSFSQNGQIIIEEDISFSSQFIYDLSKLRLLWNLGEMDEQNPDLRSYLGLHALGLSPTDLSINTFWNLIPFSWLVDWFTNIGDVFDNFRAHQTAGLQCNYAYITSTATKRMFLTSSLYHPSRFHITSTVNARQKQVRRLKATPYGFDVRFDGLSANQSGIIAALASSKAKF